MDIGGLEAEVLAAVKALRDASARDVTQFLQRSREIAYTTVNTTLDRLYRKGLLAREEARGRGGMHYVYSPGKREALRERIVTSSLQRLLNAFGPAIIPTIYEKTRELGEAELAELERAVAREKTRRE